MLLFFWNIDRRTYDAADAWTVLECTGVGQPLKCSSYRSPGNRKLIGQQVFGRQSLANRIAADSDPSLQLFYDAVLWVHEESCSVNSVFCNVHSGRRHSEEVNGSQMSA